MVSLIKQTKQNQTHTPKTNPLKTRMTKTTTLFLFILKSYYIWVSEAFMSLLIYSCLLTLETESNL